MVKSKKAKNEKVKPADWVVRAREILAVTRKRLAAEKSREDMAKANEVISDLRKEVKQAAEFGRDEVVLFTLSSNCRTLGELCGAPKLVAEYCRTVGLSAEITRGDVGENYLVAKL